MKTLLSSLVVFTFTFMVFSCTKDSDNKKELTLKGKLINHSNCKSNVKSDRIIKYYPDTVSCVNYAFDATSNKLYITHINAGFNCCPDSIYCNITLSNDTIIIEEKEPLALCDCNCLYDLSIEISGVDAKKYQLRFVEPYNQDENKLDFAINLAQIKAGEVCVTRKNYPWGIFK